MDMEPRPGKYHRDRHKPQAWYNAPLPREESQALYIRFCQAFRQSHWKRRTVTRWEWDEEHVFCFDYEDPAVWELPLVAAQPWFYVSWDTPDTICKATAAELRALPFALRHVDMYFVPETFSWVLCQSHDPDYRLFDPNGWFPELRARTRQ